MRKENVLNDTLVSKVNDIIIEVQKDIGNNGSLEMSDFVVDVVGHIEDLLNSYEYHVGDKALEWHFRGYEGKHVICNYITHKYEDNVYKALDSLEDAMEIMDNEDLWEDYYIYRIGKDGFAYDPQF